MYMELDHSLSVLIWHLVEAWEGLRNATSRVWGRSALKGSPIGLTSGTQISMEIRLGLV